VPKRASRELRVIQQRSNPEVRASAARIVDILQQLVIARPEMIIPLEEIVRGILANLHVHVEGQMWHGADMKRARGRTPLPAMPLTELPALRALLEPAAVKKRATGQPAVSAGKKKRR
jgi:hypothetical protein